MAQGDKGQSEQPLRTMIRSLDTLGGQSSGGLLGGSKAHYLKSSTLLEPNKDQVSGWAPEVEILTEQDLKKIEK